MTRLLILDMDGTVKTTASGAKFPLRPDDQIVIPQAARQIERYAADDWTIVIASNQGGVAAGHKSLSDVREEIEICLRSLPQIEIAFWCPDLEGQSLYATHRDNIHPSTVEDDLATGLYRRRSPFRKPAPGMLLAAADWAGHPVTAALFVGDRLEDENAARAAGCNFMYASYWRKTEYVSSDAQLRARKS